MDSRPDRPGIVAIAAACVAAIAGVRSGAVLIVLASCAGYLTTRKVRGSIALQIAGGLVAGAAYASLVGVDLLPGPRQYLPAVAFWPYFAEGAQAGNRLGARAALALLAVCVAFAAARLGRGVTCVAIGASPAGHIARVSFRFPPRFRLSSAPPLSASRSSPWRILWCSRS